MVIYTLAALVHLVTMHFDTGIADPFRKHSMMPTYKNWSYMLTLQVRAMYAKTLLLMGGYKHCFG